MKSIDTCIEPCLWLEFKRGKAGYPHYLWDVQARSTITAQETDILPEYICISHTWGRWLKEKEPFVAVSGVPWLVPQNTRFRVEDLPELLERNFPGMFVWLDLL